MVFIPGVQHKSVTAGRYGFGIRNMTSEELAHSATQQAVLGQSFPDQNIRIPFHIMIKIKGTPFIRKVSNGEMTFGEESTGNILLGSSFYNNSCGKSVKNNLFYQKQDIIEIDPGYITLFERFKIAYQVFKSLKY